MSGVAVGDFGSPAETRTPAKTTVEIIRMGGVAASRMRLEPGWRWSECIKADRGRRALSGPPRRSAASGTMRVVHENGSEQEIRAGEAYVMMRFD
jgi:hypothetical protein